MKNTTLVYKDTSDIDEIVKQVNKIRLANKNSWYQVTFENETFGTKTRLKCYGTWIQIAENSYFETPMDISPTAFKEYIKSGVTNLIENYEKN